MEIRSLENTPLSEITACFNLAFSDYFVPIAATETYFRSRWQANRVDYQLSFGAFDHGKLVAFIIHGIDLLHGKKTAYNSGTGVIPAYRKQNLVGQLYAYALPRLKAAGIHQSTLEVITQNHQAIKAYERVGFTINRTLHCFKGSLSTSGITPETNKNYRLEKPGTANAAAWKALRNFDFSWENKDEAVAVLGSGLETLQVVCGSEPKAYAILNPETGAIMQLGFSKTEIQPAAALLFQAIAQTRPEVKINNVDSQATQMVELLKKANLENHVDQYEMLLEL